MRTFTVFNTSHNPRLERTALAKVRPTQNTVGYAEVDFKTLQWQKLGKKKLKVEIEHHVFPAVLGPAKAYYIVDHHHLGIALLHAGIKEVFVAVLDDLSWLDPTPFWRTMEFRSWTHPYDKRGNRCDYGDMPKRLLDMADDPYRSLAGMVRGAGGFAKDQSPFVEFLWADFFRTRVAARTIAKEPRRATREGVRLAQSRVARYLPGWSGTAATLDAK